MSYTIQIDEANHIGYKIYSNGTVITFAVGVK
jgi:hypothetical protein